MKANTINFSTTNRWIACIPFKKINPNLTTDTIAFNLTNYSLPEMVLGTTLTQYHGYEIEIPTHIRAQTKELTFEYMLSEDFHQWKVLYTWVNKIADEIGSGANTNYENFVLPIRVIILTAFKTPIFEILYNNAWIKGFGSIEFDYQDPDASNIKHSFTIAYSNYELIDSTAI